MSAARFARVAKYLLVSILFRFKQSSNKDEVDKDASPPHPSGRWASMGIASTPMF